MTLICVRKFQISFGKSSDIHDSGVMVVMPVITFISWLGLGGNWSWTGFDNHFMICSL